MKKTKLHFSSVDENEEIRLGLIEDSLREFSHKSIHDDEFKKYFYFAFVQLALDGDTLREQYNAIDFNVPLEEAAQYQTSEIGRLAHLLTEIVLEVEVSFEQEVEIMLWLISAAYCYDALKQSKLAQVTAAWNYYLEAQSFYSRAVKNSPISCMAMKLGCMVIRLTRGKNKPCANAAQKSKTSPTNAALETTA